MKTPILLMLLFMALSSSKCKKEGEDCHYVIEFVNNSTETVVRATKRSKNNDPTQCMLQGIEIESHEQYEYRPYNWCIENSIGSEVIEFYVIDKDSVTLDVYYSCDSVEIKNEILRHYSLTLKDLQDNNFRITYP